MPSRPCCPGPFSISYCPSLFSAFRVVILNIDISVHLVFWNVAVLASWFECMYWCVSIIFYMVSLCLCVFVYVCRHVSRHLCEIVTVIGLFIKYHNASMHENVHLWKHLYKMFRTSQRHYFYIRAYANFRKIDDATPWNQVDANSKVDRKSHGKEYRVIEGVPQWVLYALFT